MTGKTIILIVLRFIVAVIIWIPTAFFLVVLFNYLRIGTVGICDAGVGAKVWLDVNGNGLEDSGEPPFSGACLWANSSSPSSTEDIHGESICNDELDYSGDNGVWTEMFSCGEETVFVSIKPPAGFKLSTVPLVVAENRLITFGLSPESVTVLNDIKEWDYYANLFQDNQFLKNNSRFYVFLFLLFLLISILFSWFIAKKLVK